MTYYIKIYLNAQSFAGEERLVIAGRGRAKERSSVQTAYGGRHSCFCMFFLVPQGWPLRAQGSKALLPKPPDQVYGQSFYTTDEPGTCDPVYTADGFCRPRMFLFCFKAVYLCLIALRNIPQARPDQFTRRRPLYIIRQSWPEAHIFCPASPGHFCGDTLSIVIFR